MRASLAQPIDPLATAGTIAFVHSDPLSKENPYHITATSLCVTAGAACAGHQKVVTLPETGRYGFAAYGSCPAAVTGPPVHCPLDGFCG
jgi:hypothetical protein